MKVLLLGGNERSGKTDALDRLYSWLTQTQGFVYRDSFKHYGNNPKDKGYFINRSNKNINKIILNVAADNGGCRTNLEKFVKTLSLSKADKSDLLFISAIRNPTPNISLSKPRVDMLDFIKAEFGISENQCVEIPMLHLDARLSYQEQWLKDKTDETVQNVLKSPAIGL